MSRRPRRLAYGADGRQGFALAWLGARHTATELKNRCLQFAAPGLFEGGQNRGLLTSAVRQDCPKRTKAARERLEKRRPLRSELHVSSISPVGAYHIIGNSRCPKDGVGVME